MAADGLIVVVGLVVDVACCLLMRCMSVASGEKVCEQNASTSNGKGEVLILGGFCDFNMLSGWVAGCKQILWCRTVNWTCRLCPCDGLYALAEQRVQIGMHNIFRTWHRVL